ncbi:hypothetical protein ElyMa_003217900 [Elysia marginata]|uniref:Uncharacterized protein n=1 Tax=Elysia marginata TaxID=1093978 RepID=A0AAV4J2R8_9GAST|nr:hypothetical protein ElyMa_003217900 [Elysia marginata]
MNPLVKDSAGQGFSGLRIQWVKDSLGSRIQWVKDSLNLFPIANWIHVTAAANRDRFPGIYILVHTWKEESRVTAKFVLRPRTLCAWCASSPATKKKSDWDTVEKNHRLIIGASMIRRSHLLYFLGCWAGYVPDAVFSRPKSGPTPALRPTVRP